MRDTLWEWFLNQLLELGVVGLLMAGAVGRLFVSSRPISVRMMLGELLLSIVVGVGLLSYADIQAWSAAKTIFVGSAVSLLGRALVVAYIKKRVCGRL
jgi:hypothetical protein